jgi:hypothetical protein
MSAAKYDLTIQKGEDYNFSLRILDSLDQPVTFGFAPYGVAEIREASGKALSAKFTIGGVSSGTPTDGTLKFSLSRSQTLSLDINKQYKWDFFWYKSAASKKLLVGYVNVVPNISKVLS